MFRFVERTIVEEGGMTSRLDMALGVKFKKLQLARNHAPLARSIGAGILDGMFQVEEHAHLFTYVGGIDQHGALGEQVAVLFKHQV